MLVFIFEANYSRKLAAETALEDVLNMLPLSALQKLDLMYQKYWIGRNRGAPGVHGCQAIALPLVKEKADVKGV